jgi:tetratricopeptide (TPR) repeat protein
LFFTLPAGFRLRAGVDYSQVWLSGKPFRSFNYFAGATYNVLHLSGGESASRMRERKMLAQYSSIETNYQQGVKEFNDGELLRARQNFKQILDIKSDHLEARSYMEKIVVIESDYRRASELLENKNYYAAIPLLSRSERNMKEARSSLAEIRGKLAPLVPEFERRGIQYYDRNDYENCIDLMTKVQLIDPGNRTAGIYLPRATRRYEALKKLK